MKRGTLNLVFLFSDLWSRILNQSSDFIRKLSGSENSQSPTPHLYPTSLLISYIASARLLIGQVSVTCFSLLAQGSCMYCWLPASALQIIVNRKQVQILAAPFIRSEMGIASGDVTHRIVTLSVVDQTVVSLAAQSERNIVVETLSCPTWACVFKTSLKSLKLQVPNVRSRWQLIVCLWRCLETELPRLDSYIQTHRQNSWPNMHSR